MERTPTKLEIEREVRRRFAEEDFDSRKALTEALAARREERHRADAAIRFSMEQGDSPVLQRVLDGLWHDSHLKRLVAEETLESVRHLEAHPRWVIIRKGEEACVSK